MKYYLFPLIATLLFPLSIFSQDTINISAGEEFYVNKNNSISILQRDENSILALTPRFNDHTFNWNIDTLEIDFDTYDKLERHNIGQITETALDDILENKKLSIQNRDQQIDFVLIAKNTFAYCTYDTGTSSEFEKFPKNTCNLHFIDVANRNIAVLTDNSYNTIAYLYATERDVCLNILPHLSTSTPHDSLVVLNPEEQSNIQSYFKDFHQSYKVVSVGNKYALCNRNNRRVHAQLYDNIILGDTDILTQKEGVYRLYSRGLILRDIGRIQVAYPLTEHGVYIEAIVENEHMFIKNGEKLPSNAFPYSLQLHPRNVDPSNIKYSFDAHGQHDFKIVLHPQDRFNATDYSDSIRLNSIKPLHDYQDIVFCNDFPYVGQVYEDVHSADGIFKATQMDGGFNDYDDYAKLKLENIFVQRNGKWGIDSLNMKVNQRSFELIELLPAEFDKLEELHYPTLDITTRGRLNYLGWSRQPVIFYKDKLMGVYPMTNEAKYKKVDKDITGRYFYRVVLASGKGLWLDIVSGKEIFDI